MADGGFQVIVTDDGRAVVADEVRERHRAPSIRNLSATGRRIFEICGMGAMVSAPNADSHGP